MSNFRPVKRVGIVLEIFRRIRDDVRAHLVMVGDGPDRQEIERRVGQMGLADVVHFVGEQQDPVPWLSTADVFLLPSSIESFGMAAAEAMACEVPVVASRVGGVPEVIVDGKTGWLFEPDDLAGMSARAVALLRDPDARRAMGRAAAEDVLRRFSADVIVPRYEAFYSEILGS